MFTQKNSYKIILAAVGIIVAVLGIMIYLIPPAIFPDASNGLQVMRCMQMGGGFNLMISPSQDDISKNVSSFLTWWSPGQYLAPYFFTALFKVNTGHASALTIIICQLSGLCGLYVFFRKVGFTNPVCAISLALIICQLGFITPFIFYNGGEIILFGFIGWFLTGCATLMRADWKLILFVFCSGWLGFLCKSSFMWMYLAGLMCLWVRISNGELKLMGWIKNGLFVAIPAIITIASIYVFYLSKNENPASATGALQISWQAFSYPLASPVLSGLSVDDLFNGLLYHPSHAAFFTPFYTSLVLSALALTSCLLVIWITLNFVPKIDYRLFVVVFYIAAILFFGYAFTRQLDISYEERHFRVIGLLITPGIIYFIGKRNNGYQLAFVLLWLVIAGFSCLFFIKGYTFNIRKSAHGYSGLSQEYIDQPSLNAIMAIDNQNKNAIFAFISPDLGLEIKQNRILTLDMPPPGAKFNNDDYAYDGHAGPLYILLPVNFMGDKAAMLMKFFPGYSNFVAKKLSPGYVLYAAK